MSCRAHLFLTADDTRIDTGIDNVVESLLTNMVFGPDVTAENFSVGKAAMTVGVIDANDILHSEGIAAPYQLGTILFHRA